MNFSSKIKIVDDVFLFKNALNFDEINLIYDDVNQILKKTPYFLPEMPKTGNKFSVKMTNCGKTGWVSDKKGYRYQKFHPENNQHWQEIPEFFNEIWSNFIKKCNFSGKNFDEIIENPDCCLVNYYHANSKMGLHQDKDEEDFSYPILSISLGASALFKIGANCKKDKKISVKLENGDILIFGGEKRLAFHGIDKIYVNEKFDKRINITMRKVFK